MVYLIGNTHANVGKIGFSDYPQGRLSALQTGCPYPLEILSTLEGGYPEESALHRKYKNRNLSGEWFELNENILQEFGLTYAQNTKMVTKVHTCFTPIKPSQHQYILLRSLGNKYTSEVLQTQFTEFTVKELMSILAEIGVQPLSKKDLSDLTKTNTFVPIGEYVYWVKKYLIAPLPKYAEPVTLVQEAPSKPFIE